MDVFDLRRRLVDDYASYTRSLIKIADTRVRHKVETALDEGALWPEPLLQLNPTFLSSGTSARRSVAVNRCRPICLAWKFRWKSTIRCETARRTASARRS
jgi:hypothetical protein